MAWLGLSWAIFHSLFSAPSHPKSAGSGSLFLQLTPYAQADPRPSVTSGSWPLLGLTGTMDALAVQGKDSRQECPSALALCCSAWQHCSRSACWKKDGMGKKGATEKAERWMSLQGGRCIWSPNAMARGEAMSSAAIKEQRQAVVLSSPVIPPPAVYTGQ